MSAAQFELEFLGTSVQSRPTLSFHTASEMLFELRLNEELAKSYVSQVDEDIIAANRPWALEAIVCLANYEMCKKNIEKYGRDGFTIHHPAEAPPRRSIYKYKFALDKNFDSPGELTPQYFRTGLANEIEELIKEPDINKIVDKWIYRSSWQYASLSTKVVFNL